MKLDKYTSKKIYLLLMASLFFKLSYAQPYKKLLGNENYWYLTSCDLNGCLTDFYFAKEDTIINGLIYKFLDGFHYGKNMMIREDTLQKKVYFRSKSGYKPNTDILIYDFSITVGDTIDVFDPNSPFPNYAGVYQLDSIQNISIKDGIHRAFYLSEKQGSNTTIWMEGVGSTSLINAPSQLGNIMGAGDLSCFFRDGTYVYESDTLPNGSCDTTLMTSIFDMPIKNTTITIYPNPIHHTLNINTNQPLTDKCNIIVIDLTGKIIIDTYFNTFPIVINTEKWSNGLYIIKMINNHQIYSEKIIVQH